MFAQDDILEAAISVFVRYGIRRATMSDVAKAAGVSRQTLYVRFGDKDGIIAAAIVYLGWRALADVRDGWARTTRLSERLDIYFQHAAVALFRMMQSAPDADDVISGANPVARAAACEVGAEKAALLAELFAPYSAQLALHGQTAEGLGVFVAESAANFKHSAGSEADLLSRLSVLKAAALLLCGDAG